MQTSDLKKYLKKRSSRVNEKYLYSSIERRQQEQTKALLRTVTTRDTKSISATALTRMYNNHGIMLQRHDVVKMHGASHIKDLQELPKSIQRLRGYRTILKSQQHSLYEQQLAFSQRKYMPTTFDTMMSDLCRKVKRGTVQLTRDSS